MSRCKPPSWRVAWLVVLCPIVMAVSRVPGVDLRSQGKQIPLKNNEERIKLKADLIQLTAVVSGSDGELIPDLKKSDFELLENGRTQDISFFSAEAAAGGNPSSAAEQPSRAVVLFVDTLHLSPSSLLRAKQALKQFVRDSVSRNDLVSMVCSDGTVGLTGQFTLDREATIYAIDRLSPSPRVEQPLFTPALAAEVVREQPDALEAAMSIIRAEQGASIPPELLATITRAKARDILSQASHWRNVSIAVLKQVIDRLSGMPAQRLVAMVSEGFTLLGRSGASDTTEIRSVVSRATRSGVTLYTIDARGIYVPAIFSASTRGAPLEVTPRISRYLLAADEDAKNSLNALARDTGGRPFFNTNDLSGSLKKALDDNRIYYTLAYHPSPDDNTDGFREITIRVKGHPDFVVRSQRGYLAKDLIEGKEEEAKTPDQKLSRALDAVLPEAAIRIACLSYFIEREGKPETLLVKAYVGGERLAYVKEGELQRLRLTLWTLVFDSSGKPVHRVAEDIQGNVRSEQLAEVNSAGYAYSKAFSVKPGLYQVRVGVYDHASGLVGTALSWVEVPDTSGSKPALGSIILSREQGEQSGSLESSGQGDRPAIKDGVPLYPVGGVLVYHVAVYNAGAASNQPSPFQFRLEMSGDGEIVYRSEWKPLASRQIGQDKKAIYVGGQLHLSEMQPGLYEIRISVRQGQKEPLQQKAIFIIEPASTAPIKR